MGTWEYKHFTVSASPRAGSPVAGALAASPPRACARRAADLQSWCDTSHLSEPTDTLGEEEESPGAYEYECFLTAGRGSGPAEAVIRHQGWLLKAYGKGPQRRWRRRWVYLTADRLCYTSDPTVDGVRYIPLDRIPVRALPRGYGPKIGVAQLDESNPTFSPGPAGSPKKFGCSFSVACGSHTHFLAAETPAAAKVSWMRSMEAQELAWHENGIDAVKRCLHSTVLLPPHLSWCFEISVSLLLAPNAKSSLRRSGWPRSARLGCSA